MCDIFEVTDEGWYCLSDVGLGDGESSDRAIVAGDF